MDKWHLQIEKIIGPHAQNCAVFNKRIALSDESIATLIVCILVDEAAGDDLQTIFRDVFDLAAKKIEDADSRTSTLDILTTAINKAEDFLSQKEIKASLGTCLFHLGVCYLVLKGEKIKLLIFDPPAQKEIDFGSGSGPAKAGQIYLLATSQFRKNFDASILTKSGIDITELADGLATEVLAKDEQEEVCAILVQVKDIENKEIIEDQEPQNLQKPEEKEEPHPPKINKVTLTLRAIIREIAKVKRGEIGAVLRVRRSLVIIGLIIILILAGSGAYTIYQKQQKAKQAEFNTHLDRASAKYAEALAIMELNRQRAREILVEARREVNAAQSIDQNSQSAQKLAGDIETKLRESEITATVNFETAFEIETAISAISQDSAKLIGASAQGIFKASLLEKKIDNLQDLNNIKSIFFYDGRVFTLTDDKIWRLDLTSEKLEEALKSVQGQDLAVFLGNIYLLSQDGITKFSPIEGGYAAGISYLDQKTAFGASSKMAIDGNIWATNGNKILKFLRGKPQTFEISGLVGAPGEFGEIYTNPDSDNIYVIDKTNSALLIIGKDGIYKKIYQSPEFARAADLLISNDENKIYIAVGNKILEASL